MPERQLTKQEELFYRARLRARKQNFDGQGTRSGQAGGGSGDKSVKDQKPQNQPGPDGFLAQVFDKIRRGMGGQ